MTASAAPAANRCSGSRSTGSTCAASASRKKKKNSRNGAKNVNSGNRNARKKKKKKKKAGNPSGLFDDREDVPARYRRALDHVQLLDLAGAVSGDLVLHLHRLDHADQIALGDLGALLH